MLVSVVGENPLISFEKNWSLIHTPMSLLLAGVKSPILSLYAYRSRGSLFEFLAKVGP